MPRPTPSLETIISRFHSYYIVDPTTQCWNWSKYKHDGYGRFSYLGEIQAHRVSWLIHNGASAGDMCVCHRCDNPACVNPAHLFLGTYADNNHDKKAKNRHMHGVKSPTCLLTEEDVLEIRSRYVPYKVKYIDLANEFGLTTTAVYKIIKRITWSHI